MGWLGLLLWGFLWGCLVAGGLVALDLYLEARCGGLPPLLQAPAHRPRAACQSGAPLCDLTPAGKDPPNLAGARLDHPSGR